MILSKFAYSTHIIGGEIRANRTSETSFTYSISLILYTDDTSPVPAGNGVINFGDGSGDYNLTDVIASSTKEELPGERSREVFLVDHTFSTPGSFTISFREFNRSPNFINIINSVNTPFYIESNVVIDPFFGKNSSAELRSIPLFDGTVGAIYLENPQAFDADGDSLAIKPVVPLWEKDMEVNDYLFPHQIKDSNDAAASSEGTYFPTFGFDSETGILSWDAPVVPGSYAVAYEVEEWRKIEGQAYLLGSVTRDYVVKIEDIANKRPFLKTPNEITIRAGELFTIDFMVGDPDGDEFVLVSTGMPYELESQSASYTVNENNVNFSWQPGENHIREQPYKIIFKIADNPSSGSRLYDYKEWNIHVTTLTNSLDDDYVNLQNLQIFPNPSKGIFNVKNTFPSKHPFTLQVYNQLGQQIIEKVTREPGEEITLDLSGHKGGIYLVKYLIHRQKFSKKLVLLD